MITYTPMKAGGYQFQYLKVDLGLLLPYRDLSIDQGLDRPGAVVMNTMDNSPYYKNASGWVLFGSGVAGVLEPAITPSTLNTFWNGLKSFVQINADQLLDGATNKFFTNALARAAISGATPINYDAATGIISIDPANGMAVSGTSPILYDATTGVFSLDLSVLDARYAASLATLLFSNGLLKDGVNVTALTDNALWNANKLQGYPVTSEEPADGAVMKFNGTTSTWEFYYP